MGNWRTVTIVGTCPADQVEALRKAAIGERDKDGWAQDYRPLMFNPPTRSTGLFALGDWVGEHIDASGNCYERDFTIDDIMAHLRELVTAAPGLSVKVHCGGDWEGAECVATLIVTNGAVVRGAPEIERIRGVSMETAQGRMAGGLMGMHRSAGSNADDG